MFASNRRRAFCQGCTNVFRVRLQLVPGIIILPQMHGFLTAKNAMETQSRQKTAFIFPYSGLLDFLPGACRSSQWQLYSIDTCTEKILTPQIDIPGISDKWNNIFFSIINIKTINSFKKQLFQRIMTQCLMD